MRRLVILLVVAGAAYLLWRTFVMRPFTVPEQVNYMAPALEPGTAAVLDRVSYLITPPHRGDIVAVAAPATRLGFEVLRIVAVPGETVEVQGGKLLIEGAAAAESYARGALPLAFPARRVPQGHYFVLADDRGAYYAGRKLGGGVVPRREIMGRVLPAGG